MYRIIFFCPDTNFVYDGHTPDTTGLGGGKTALIRMANTMGRLGHDVIVYGNCVPGVYDGVTYRDFRSLAEERCDVFVLITTSAPDVSALDLGGVHARLRIVWAQGRTPIRGLEHLSFDWLYAVSHYLANVVVAEWGVLREKVFVTYNAHCAENLAEAARVPTMRDPYSIIFASHPSKGLERIREIVQELRLHDPRYRLDSYGGNALWGSQSTDAPNPGGNGFSFFGMLNQRELAARFYKYGLMLALSDVPDTSSITILEAKKAGVIVIASGVGGNPEIIQHGYDGFIISGDYRSDEAKQEAISLVLALLRDPEWADSIRQHGLASTQDWQHIAASWLDHWQSILQPLSLAARQPNNVSTPGTLTMGYSADADGRAPTVSVLLPVFNAAPYLRQAIDSILGQTFQDFELIVVDDGSTDNSWQILKGLTDPRIVRLRQPNRGTWAAVNAGLDRAQGVYIARMDADDISLPDRLQRQVQFLDNHKGVALVGCQFAKIDGDGRVISHYSVPLSDRALRRALPIAECCFCHGAVMMRREALQQVGAYRPGKAEDVDLWLRLSERYRTANLLDELYYLRRAGDSRVTRETAEMIAATAAAKHWAWQRYAAGRDAMGYPAERIVNAIPISVWLSPARELYAETLMVWARLASDRDPALRRRLLNHAALLDPRAHARPEASYWQTSRVRSVSPPNLGKHNDALLTQSEKGSGAQTLAALERVHAEVSGQTSAIPSSGDQPAARTERFVFVIPVYNAERYIENCLDSALSQRNREWGAVVVDDASTDGTLALIRAKVGSDARFVIVANAERRYALFNIDRAVTEYCINPESVIGVLDGDDWLAHDDVVDKVLAAHQQYDLVWSNYCTYPEGAYGEGDYIPPLVDARHYRWVTWPFRTFKKSLFDRIAKKDLIDADGHYFAMTYDYALMLPMLELAGPKKRHYLDEVLYVYNRETALNDDKIDHARQLSIGNRIEALPSYACINPPTTAELAAMTQTPWLPGGSSGIDWHVIEPEIVLFGFPTRDPRHGDWVGVSRIVPAHPGDRFSISLKIRDYYRDPRFVGRLEQQVFLDGRLVWRHDISGNDFAGWNDVELQGAASSDGIEVKVQLTAVGNVESGWGWGEHSRTTIKAFTARLQAADALTSPVPESSDTKPAIRTERFVFVIPVYNAERYIGKCLESVLSQRNPAWGAIVIDDASTDGTLAVIREKVGSDERFTVVANRERRYALYNIDQAVTQYCVNLESVIGVLDGDDWLAHDEVVDRLLAAHQQYNLVWSNLQVHPTGYLGYGNTMPPRSDVRRHMWVCSQFRTFKKSLFDRIAKKDFLDEDGHYFVMGYDHALMLPMLELAGPKKRHYLDEVLYIYNRESSLNDDKVDPAIQSATIERIRARAPYPCLYPLTENELAELTHSQWVRYGAADGILDVFDPSTVELGFGTWDPAPKEYVGARQVFHVQRGHTYRISLHVRDRYPVPTYPGRIEQQVFVDGRMIWRHDISGDTFVGWSPIEVDVVAASEQLELAVEVRAVGDPERGWKWALGARTTVRSPSVQAIAELPVAAQPILPLTNTKHLSFFISGYYGFGNAGDEAILAGTIEQLRKQAPDCRICVASDDPAATSHEHGVAAVHRLALNGLQQSMADADLVISGGGGLFQDYDGLNVADLFRQMPSGMTFYATVPLMARALGKRTMIYGQGVGPLASSSAREFMAFLGASVNLLTVRDQVSRDLLISLGIPSYKVLETADPAFAWSGLGPANDHETDRLRTLPLPPDKPVVGVAVREWLHDGISGERWQRQLAAALDGLVENLDLSILFIPFHVGASVDDRCVAEAVRSYMQTPTRAHVITDVLDTHGVARTVSQCALLIGMRLHSLVMAAAAGLPLIAIVYDPKVRALMRALGKEEFVLDLRALTAEALGRLARAAWAQRDALRMEILQAARILAGRAECNAELALKLAVADNVDLSHSLPVNTAQVEPEVRQPSNIFSTDDWTATPSEMEAWQQELSAIVQEHGDRKGIVIVAPTIDWSVPAFQRPHQLALALARYGYLVFFCLRRESPDAPAGLCRVDERLYLSRVPAALLREMPCQIVLTVIYNAQYARHFDNPVIIYDHIDELEVFPFDGDWLARNHLDVVRVADVVMASATSLHEQVQVERPDAILVPNGVDYDQFAPARNPETPPPQDLTTILALGKPVIGYYGVLAEWLDYELLLALATERPDLSFVFIGLDRDGTGATHPVFQCANVHWLGPRPYQALPSYLRYFNVAIIPFKLNRITRSTSPIKLFEYLAGCKPVVSTPLPECLNYPGVLIAATAEEFSTELNRALSTRSDASHLAIWDEQARANTWDARVALLAAALEEVERAVRQDNKPALVLPPRERRSQKLAYLQERRMEVLTHTRDGLARQVQALSASQQRMLEEHERLAANYRLAQDRLGELERRSAALDAEHRDARDLWQHELSARENMITTLRSEAEFQRREADAKLAERDRRLTDLQTYLQVQRELMEQARVEYESTMAALRSEGESQRREADYQLAERDRRLIELQAELKAQRETMESARMEYEGALAALRSQSESQRAEANAKLDDRDRAIESLACDLSARTNEMERRLSELHNMKNALESDMRAWRRQADSTSKELLSVHQSRAWRAATLYWTTRDRARHAAETVRRETIHRPAQALTRLRQRLTMSRHGDGSGPSSPHPLFGVAELTRRYDLVVFPIIDWEFRFQRPQQLAQRFADRGHRVFYLRTTFRLPDAEYPLFQISSIRPNVVGLQLACDHAINLYQDRLSGSDLDQCLAEFELLRLEQHMTTACCVVQLPFWSPLALRLREKYGWRVIFDCMDQHSGFSTNDARMLAEESELTRRADLVVVTSQVLDAEKRVENPNTVLIPNGTDYEHFSKTAACPTELLALPHPIVGYYGAISDWFDVGAVSRMAAAHPDWSVVLVGSTFGADVSGLQTLPNVHLIGEVPYSVLPGYLHAFDVCLIPFLRNSLTDATNPVKFYEYLSAGKPVVATMLPELLPHPNFVYLAERAEQFGDLVEQALREDTSDKRLERQVFARENTWDARCLQMETSIKARFSLVSLVIIAFDGLDLTKRTIESIQHCTAYPNYELIIVDNASSDGTRDYLSTLAAQCDSVKIILNESNQGFGRAVNQGLALARGEFLVVLNNDIVVTRGWLSKLLSHLQDPSIGLLGPVTNWAGNEARIDVGYRDLAEMEEFAQAYTQSHLGVTFDIRVVAMFCMAMTRRTYDLIGPLDEQFEVGMFEDDDYAQRSRQHGLRVVCAEDVFVHHAGRAAFSKIEAERYAKIFESNKHRFEQKWKSRWIPHQDRKPQSQVSLDEPERAMEPVIPGAILIANPNPVPAGKKLGRTTIAWQADDQPDCCVYVSVNDAAETLFANGPTGSKVAPWIDTGVTYQFRLYSGTDKRMLLSNVVVTRKSAGPNANR